MPLIQITRCWDGNVIHELEAVDQKDALQQLVLRDANLGGANLRRIRDDFWAVLSGAPVEAPALLEALRAGKIDGSTYSGACACLVGTLANARGCDYDKLVPIVPDSGRLAEVWFTAIRPGDTPETSQPAQLAAEWIAEWLDRMRAAFGPPAASQEPQS